MTLTTNVLDESTLFPAQLAQKTRNCHIDTAKGLSIVLVVLGHSYFSVMFPDVFGGLSLLRMPLFFFLAGIFFKPELKFSTLVSKKSESLLKPYFSFLTLIIILEFLLKGEPLAAGLKDIMLGLGTQIPIPPMWFLPHLFLVFVGALLIQKIFVKLSNFQSVIGLLALYMLGIFSLEVFNDYSARTVVRAGWLFSFDLLLFSIPVFSLGTKLKRHVLNFTPDLSIFMIAIIVFAVSASFGGFLDLNYRAAGAAALVFGGSLAGIYLALTLTYYMSKIGFVNKVFTYLGRESLFLLIFHSIVFLGTKSLLAKIDDTGVLLLASAITFICSILISLMAAFVIRRFNIFSIFFLPMQGKTMQPA